MLGRQFKLASCRLYRAEETLVAVIRCGRGTE